MVEISNIWKGETSVKSAGIKVGVTINEETYKRLQEDAKNLGLTKSQYIAMLINTAKKGDKDE